MSDNLTSGGHHKHKRALTSALLAAVIFAGGYYIYDQGFMPGVGNNKKAVEQLQRKIESFEGKNIEASVYEMFAGSSVISRMPEAGKASFNTSLKETLDKDIDLIFTYSALEAQSGGVKIIDPKISVVSVANAERNYDIRLPALYVSQVDNEEGRYLFRAEGDIDFFADTAKTGEKSKTFSLKHGKLEAEMKFAGGYTQLQKMHAENLKLTEGRSGTLLISVAQVNTETVQKHENGKKFVATKASYSQIAPGDMIKLFIGNLEPVDIKLDYLLEERLEPVPEQKTYDSQLKINNFAIKMGKAGMESNANISYMAHNNNAPLSGDMYVKFTQYHKVLTILQKYYPVRPEDMRAVANFLMEAGADEGEDASFDVRIYGKENIKINGKTEEEFDKILERNFPEQKENAPKPVEKIPTIEKKKL